MSVTVRVNALLVVARRNHTSSFASCTGPGPGPRGRHAVDACRPVKTSTAGVRSTTRSIAKARSWPLDRRLINLNNGLVLSGRLASTCWAVTDRQQRRLGASPAGRLGRQPIRRQRRDRGFHASAGTNTLSNTLYLGYNSADNGTYNLSGTAQLSAPTQYVGYSGTGTFAQSGGTNTASNYLYLGYNTDSNGA